MLGSERRKHECIFSLSTLCKFFSVGEEPSHRVRPAPGSSAAQKCFFWNILRYGGILSGRILISFLKPIPMLSLWCTASCIYVACVRFSMLAGPDHDASYRDAVAGTITTPV